MLRKRWVIASLTIVAALSLLNACNEDQIQRLQSENAQLRSDNKKLLDENSELKDEIAKLKETAEYHYQQGIQLFSEAKYEEAKNEFQNVISKYPLSPIAASANNELSKVEVELHKIEDARLAQERKRQEEQKYIARSEEDMIKEWTNFRKNEDSLKGTITTWKLKLAYISSQGILISYVGGNTDKTVAITGSKYEDYRNDVFVGNMPVVKEKDCFQVTGKFIGVSSDNMVVLEPIRVKNLGYLDICR